LKFDELALENRHFMCDLGFQGWAIPIKELRNRDSGQYYVGKFSASESQPSVVVKINKRGACRGADFDFFRKRKSEPTGGPQLHVALAICW
jgi:hypothetical protein